VIHGRGRAVGFASAAAVCAGLAAAATQTRSGDLAAAGELRDVVVAARPLPAHEPIKPAELEDSIDLRRVPERFVPPDALSGPEQAVGRRPAVAIAAGSYLLASEFTAPRRPAGGDAQTAADPGHRPVEITVVGAGALADAPTRPRRVDVVVTTEPGPGGGTGRTYVAARAVELLDLSPADDGSGDDVVPGPTGDRFTATLALTRAQALRLIQAESFARAVRLIER
jgi:Flp pilus assembly protein CpaB